MQYSGREACEASHIYYDFFKWPRVLFGRCRRMRLPPSIPQRSRMNSPASFEDRCPYPQLATSSTLPVSHDADPLSGLWQLLPGFAAVARLRSPYRSRCLRSQSSSSYIKQRAAAIESARGSSAPASRLRAAGPRVAMAADRQSTPQRARAAGRMDGARRRADQGDQQGAQQVGTAPAHQALPHRPDEAERAAASTAQGPVTNEIVRELGQGGGVRARNAARANPRGAPFSMAPGRSAGRPWHAGTKSPRGERATARRGGRNSGAVAQPACPLLLGTVGAAEDLAVPLDAMTCNSHPAVGAYRRERVHGALKNCRMCGSRPSS
jgi:hypothetical protein